MLLDYFKAALKFYGFNNTKSSRIVDHFFMHNVHEGSASQFDLFPTRPDA